MTITRTAARVALVGIAALSFAACSSDSSKKAEEKLEQKLDSAEKKLAEEADKAKEAAEAKTSSTTAAPTSSTAPAPPCATEAEATTALGSKGTATDTPICENGYAAGSASSTEVDFAYILQYSNGSWAQASEEVQNEICTTNPQHLSQEFVNAGCDD